MSRKINQSDEALDDVMQVADYISEQVSLNASDRYLAATKQTFLEIADMPGIGVLRDYGNPKYAGMRMCPVSSFPKYLVFYLTHENEIEILRVLHGARDIAMIFAPEKPNK